MSASQCDRVLAVLSDGRPHSIQEIHDRAGSMRLNSRVADLRKRGLNIVHWSRRSRDVRGRPVVEHFYRLVLGEGAGSGLGSAPSSSDQAGGGGTTGSGPLTHGTDGDLVRPRSLDSEPLSLFDLEETRKPAWA